MSIQPLHDQVFLVRIKAPETTSSGLHVPESAQDRGVEARVVAVGPGRLHPETGIRMPMSVAAGDRAILARYQGTEVQIPDEARAALGVGDREPVLVVREPEILAIVGGIGGTGDAAP
jgi:chaperonin GroES